MRESEGEGARFLPEGGWVMYPLSAVLDLYRATRVLVQVQVPLSHYEKQSVLKTYVYLNFNAKIKIR